MKLLILVFFLLLIPISVYATHQNLDKACSISVNGQLLPITYNEEFRNNPDGTRYSGDGFHYLFIYRGSETCASFKVEPIISEQLDVLTHYSIEGNTFDVLKEKTNHSHNDEGLKVAYLRTDHYYKLIKTKYDCSDWKSNRRSCPNFVYVEPVEPTLSIREDKKLTTSQENIIYIWKGTHTQNPYQALRDHIISKSTYSWGITKIGLEHHHEINHTLEDQSTITSFENLVTKTCSNLKINNGCIFGHAEIKIKLNEEICLYSELEKLNIDSSKQPIKKNELKQNYLPYTESKDECKIQNTNLELTVKGFKIRCSNDECIPIKVSKTKNLTPPIIDPNFEIILKKPALKDTKQYDAMNLDGTYYHNDPVTITHEPTLLWKDDRAQTIQFYTTKEYELIKETDFDCKDNKCEYIVALDGLWPTNHIFGNGKGITIYNATKNYQFGNYMFDYFMTTKNIDREISNSSASINAEIVPYNPTYQSYPYPLLEDNKEYAFDDRQAIALQYFGSSQNDIIYPERRSIINGWYNIGVGYDPYTPHILAQNFTFSEGHNSSEYTALESKHNTAMFIQKGYGKIYFDYPLLDIVLPDNRPKFENVTSYTTLSSNDFAGTDTFLEHYSMRYPEAPFTKNLIIKSVDKNGTIINDSISIKSKPYIKIGTEYITGYIYDKINFDTDDKIFAEIIANDTYPMKQEYHGIGILNVTISKTGLFFDEHTKQSDIRSNDFSGKIKDLSSLNKTPEIIRFTAPYDIGLSVLSPTSITITVNGIENTFDERYYSFGGKQIIIINTQKDNTFEIERSFGKIIINPPVNFGFINSVHIDKKIIRQNCEIGCILLFQPDKELTITLENIWGGIATVTLPEINRPLPPQSKEPDYQIISAIFLILVIIYILYKKFRQN